MSTDPSKNDAVISFQDQHNLTVDVLNVTSVTMGSPIQLDKETWMAELVVHSINGNVSLQMLTDDPSRFQVMLDEQALEEDLAPSVPDSREIHGLTGAFFEDNNNPDWEDEGGGSGGGWV